MSESSCHQQACPLTGDVGHFFLPFYNLVKGAVVASYNGSGIVGLNNVHLSRIILDAVSAKIKSLKLKQLPRRWLVSRVTGRRRAA